MNFYFQKQDGQPAEKHAGQPEGNPNLWTTTFQNKVGN